MSDMLVNKIGERGYKYPEDYIYDIIATMERVLIAYKKRVISDDDFEEFSFVDDIEDDFRKNLATISKAEDELFEPLAFERVCNTFELDDLEKFCFMLSLTTAGNNSRFYSLFAELNGNSRLVHPTYTLALKLYDFVNGQQTHRLYARAMELEKNLKHLIFDDKGNGSIILSDILYTYLITNGKSFPEIKGIELYKPNPHSEPLPIMEDIAESIVSIVKKTIEIPPTYFYLSGPQNCGKMTQVKKFSDLSNIPIVIADLYNIEKTDKKTFENLFENIGRVAAIIGGAVCISNVQETQNDNKENAKLLEYIIETMGNYADVIFLLSFEEKYDISLKDERLWIDLPIRLPTTQESISMWADVIEKLPLDGEVEASEFANKFSYTPGQILETFYEAERLVLKSKENRITVSELYKCAHKQTVHKIVDKANIVYTKNSWDNLVLPDREKNMLKNACGQVKYKHVVYENWGMNEKLSYGKGISMLFSGPPGTGKTMGANVIANELDIEMYQVNMSQIVSKYIGETEKNLQSLFEEAKKTSVILFFDEADAILGKRTNVKDSHDKNANFETSFLLQKMEEYPGITIMTTNHLENIDAAFFRRISYIVHFPFPEPDSRKKIWEGMFPSKMPIEPDIDFDYLANQFEISGGNIKNIVVAAAFLAAQEDTAVDMQHILLALKYELSKQGKNISRSEFGEYEYLMKNI